MLALCPNTPEVWIYANCGDPDSANWERKWVLSQHELVVSAMDWHPATGKLVTCSHECVCTHPARRARAQPPHPTTTPAYATHPFISRSAFVWTLAGGTWSPQVVILPHNRACLDVKWSPDGRKFAVASGSKKALIAFFDPANNWWVSRETAKAKSTVLALAWHPSSLVIATASCDYSCTVVSAFMEDVDGAAAPGATPFGALPEAGEAIAEFEASRAWVNDVAWSPSGGALAFAGHDSLLHVVTFGAGGAAVMQTIKCPTLPATRLLFLSETALVSVGHSMNPEVYVAGAGAGGGIGAPQVWRFSEYLDKRPEAGAAKAATGGVAAARAMFASKATKGQSAAAAGDGEWMKHQNAIMGIKGFAASGAWRPPPSPPLKHTSAPPPSSPPSTPSLPQLAAACARLAPTATTGESLYGRLRNNTNDTSFYCGTPFFTQATTAERRRSWS